MTSECFSFDLNESLSEVDVLKICALFIDLNALFIGLSCSVVVSDALSCFF